MYAVEISVKIKPVGFDESWLKPGCVVPVDVQTTYELVREIQRLRALQPEVQAWSNCERCGAAYLHQHPEADPAVVAEQRACEAAEWKNAARYRFLKAYQPPRGEPGLVEELCLEIPSDGWDAAIDKAMAAASKPQKRSPADGAS